MPGGVTRWRNYKICHRRRTLRKRSSPAWVLGTIDYPITSHDSVNLFPVVGLFRSFLKLLAWSMESFQKILLIFCSSILICSQEGNAGNDQVLPPWSGAPPDYLVSVSVRRTTGMVRDEGGGFALGFMGERNEKIGVVAWFCRCWFGDLVFGWREKEQQ